jgi:hypothetical protein
MTEVKTDAKIRKTEDGWFNIDPDLGAIEFEQLTDAEHFKSSGEVRGNVREWVHADKDGNEYLMPWSVLWACQCGRKNYISATSCSACAAACPPAAMMSARAASRWNKHWERLQQQRAYFEERERRGEVIKPTDADAPS